MILFSSDKSEFTVAAAVLPPSTKFPPSKKRGFDEIKAVFSQNHSQILSDSGIRSNGKRSCEYCKRIE